MRIPVFAANNSHRICKKSESYVLALVAENLASWNHPTDRKQGVTVTTFLRMNPEDSLKKAAGSGFDTAWSQRQSGFAGPLVWQLKTPRQVTA